MANLMRPALYGSYHHITVMGKENAPKDHVYDVTGSLCENNDKFAIQRELPKIDIGDRIIIHDAGAHGHSMGFNYMVNCALPSCYYIRWFCYTNFVVLKPMMTCLELLDFPTYNLILRIE